MTAQKTMIAWRQRVYGGADVVRREEIPLPRPEKGEVLVRVRATGLNAGDARIMTGTPYLVRLFFGIRRPRVAVRGRDIAGTVVACGSGVTGLRLGDEVVGEMGGGGLAEHVVGRADRWVSRPTDVDVVSAACLPVAGGTAVQAIALADVAPGSRVLVLGGASGVGVFAVQLAVDAGAEVWATCGERAEPLLRDLGAVRTFDRRKTPAASLPPGTFDAIIDIAGDARLRDLRDLLRLGGVAVLVAGTGSRLLGPIGRIFRALFVSRPSRRLRPLAAKATPEITRDLLALLRARRLRVPLQRVWPLEDAQSALAHIAAGHTVGKVAVVVE